ncbi:Hypothetical predicted protein [Marmota monax]|uniref:Uncharacterized protein n=1 Tax=Marmota monax TaxID=9995 RepID=A0A5E4BGU5_MARMO|nr:hypothetical protein GHT09_010863 [Marmota monax]VTJ68605.1 Hypothetical predicted protein [Marmota monax]
MASAAVAARDDTSRRRGRPWDSGGSARKVSLLHSQSARSPRTTNPSFTYPAEHGQRQ